MPINDPQLREQLPLKAGDIVNNGLYDYVIESSEVNEGGFGRIYRAIGSRLNKDGSPHISALKEFYVFKKLDLADRCSQTIGLRTIEDSRSSVKDMRKMFTREADILLALKKEHVPHIPTIHDHPQISNGIFEYQGRTFYAMTYIEGPTLTEYVKKRVRHPLTEAEALDYIAQIAEVLHKIHVRYQFVHCDISPNNIMIKNPNAKDKCAVLVDFGNAKSYNQTAEVEVDGKKTVLGTPGYYAPSTFFGTPCGDVFSLAATLYFLLTGETPPSNNVTNRLATMVEHLQKRGVSNKCIQAILQAQGRTCEECTPTAEAFLHQLTI